MRVVIFCVLIAQATPGPGMPAQPDFSGRWTLVAAIPSDAGAPQALTVRQSVRRTNIRGEPMTPFYDQVAVERDSAAGATADTHLIGITGGTVGGVVSGRGNTRTIPPSVNSEHRVAWEGNTLVFELRTYIGDSWQPRDWTTRRETWALQPNGELAIDVATSSSGDRPRAVSATYRRRE